MASASHVATSSLRAQAATGSNPRYWRALCDTTVFHAPYGRPVGDIEEGTVVEEGMRYIDPFDDMWIAVQAEDSTVAWIRRYGTGNLVDMREAEWEPAVDARAAAAAAGTGAGAAAAPAHLWDEKDILPVDVQTNVMAHALPLVTPDAVFMDYYWSTVKPSSAAESRDWNHEFQSAIEDILFKFSPPSVDSREALMKIFAEFADEVQESANTIVSEMFTPLAERTVKRHPTAADVYFHNGVLYRLCIDTSGGFFGGDKNAIKVASQVHKAVHKLLELAPMFFLNVPLVTVMTFNGYRISASTIPPVRLHRQLFGPPCQAMSTTCATPSSAAAAAVAGGSSRQPPTSPRHASAAAAVPAMDPGAAKRREIVSRALDALGSALSLKRHEVNPPQEIMIGTSSRSTGPQLPPHLPLRFLSRLPAELQVFAGLDHRLYVTNCGRLFPPIAPSQSCPSFHPMTTPLFTRIRPEVIERCGRELNPDAFFPGCSDTESNEEIVTITQWLRDEGIPTVSAMIGMHEAVEHPEQPVARCSDCGREVSNELRFVACRCASSCTQLCSHCYVELMKCVKFDADGEATASQRLQQLVGKMGCEGRTARKPKGCLMSPDVTTLMHSNCVNMRYLSQIYHRLPESATLVTAKYLEVEMIARAAKHLLWSKLRMAQDVESVKTACVNFYLALLQGEGDLAEAFWANDLGPQVQSLFDIFAPFDTSELDTELVYSRVSELTGVELTEASVHSFDTEEPFVQLAAVHPVMKLQHIPQFVASVGGHQHALSGNLEELLLMWIGIDEQSVSSSEGAQKEDQRWWESQYPLYLKERF